MVNLTVADESLLEALVLSPPCGMVNSMALRQSEIKDFVLSPPRGMVKSKSKIVSFIFPPCSEPTVWDGESLRWESG